MNPLDVGTVTLAPAVVHRLVPGFLIPTSWPETGSTMQTRSVAEAAPSVTLSSRVVTLPLPTRLAAVLCAYLAFPSTAAAVALASVPAGLEDAAVALASLAARALAEVATASGFAGSKPRTSGMIVLLLTLSVRGWVCFCF